MKAINNLFHKFWFKMAMIISALILTLFAILNLVVIYSSQSTFVSVLTAEPGFTIYPTSHGAIVDPYTYKFDVKEINPLGEKFKQRFTTSLLFVIGISALGAVGVGLLSSKLITGQLGKLKEGMKNLRDSNYKFQLPEGDTEEFKALTSEFNMLVNELQTVEDLRKDLISDTSHELKTPLTSLLGQLQGIKDGVLKPDEQRIQSLLDQVERLSDLVEKLQSYSRLRGKAMKLKKHDVKIAAVVDQLASQFDQQLKEKKIKLINKIPPDFKLKADKEMLEQVLINLLENTLRYSKANEITVSLENNQFVFADNGVGIPKEHLGYVFERFYRVEKSRNRETGGLGLGLAIVKEIVEAHGWKIKAENNNGKGVRFVITLQSQS